MRGTWIKVLSLFALAIATAGCQSAGATSVALTSSDMSDMFLATSANPPAATPMLTGAQQRTPPGFVSFCIRNPDQCIAPTGAPSTVAENAQLWQTLNRVNDQINTTIAPETDERHYGREEFWTIPTDGFGDCEDYALAKRKALIDAGLPMDALRIAVVRMWNGDRHAVLTVSTDRGDLVLDNLNRQIRPWNDVDYVWLERQAADNPQNWVGFRSGSTPLQLASVRDQPNASGNSQIPASEIASSEPIN